MSYSKAAAELVIGEKRKKQTAKPDLSTEEPEMFSSTK